MERALLRSGSSGETGGGILLPGVRHQGGEVGADVVEASHDPRGGRGAGGGEPPRSRPESVGWILQANRDAPGLAVANELDLYFVSCMFIQEVVEALKVEN